MKAQEMKGPNLKNTKDVNKNQKKNNRTIM